jgi:hypothetical protein
MTRARERQNDLHGGATLDGQAPADNDGSVGVHVGRVISAPRTRSSSAWSRLTSARRRKWRRDPCSASAGLSHVEFGRHAFGQSGCAPQTYVSVAARIMISAELSPSPWQICAGLVRSRAACTWTPATCRRSSTTASRFGRMRRSSRWSGTGTSRAWRTRSKRCAQSWPSTSGRGSSLSSQTPAFMKSTPAGFRSREMGS